MSGLQCPLLLWMLYNDKEAVPKPDESLQARFDEGKEIGNWAKKIYPGGVEVEFGKGFGYSIAQTRVLLSQRKVLFEASASHANCFCRTDILVPSGADEWDLIEVKSSASVKEEHFEDVAFQWHCLSGAGVKLSKAYLMHVNTSYVRQGQVEPDKLFASKDITAQVLQREPLVAGRVKEMLAMIKGPRPVAQIGVNCNSPHECNLCGKCFSFLPKYPVTDLYCGAEKRFELVEKGVLSLEKVPDDFELTPRQKLQVQAAKTGKPIVNEAELRKWFASLEYPLYFLDFETFAPAVPVLEGTRPFQAVPFQFSLHIMQKSGVENIHVEFLHDSATDPRPGIADALSALGTKGTVVAYNAQFEQRVIRQLAAQFPQHSARLEKLADRFVDLLVPFRNFWYYHPDQQGSCSIKSVLPAVIGKSYEGLEIGNGDTAAREYLRVTYGDANKAEREKTYSALKLYCGQDTQAMVDLLVHLRALIEK